MNELRVRGGLVERLSSALRNAGAGLGSAPVLLRRVLDEEAWTEFETQLGAHPKPLTFQEFVTTPPLKGLGATVELVKKIASGDPALELALDKAMRQRQGTRTDLPYNVREVPREQGNARTAMLRRLEDGAPELHARVLANEISPHAAMVQAGFRPRTVTIPLGDPARTAAALRRHIPAELLHELCPQCGQEVNDGA